MGLNFVRHYKITGAAQNVVAQVQRARAQAVKLNSARGVILSFNYPAVGEYQFTSLDPDPMTGNSRLGKPPPLAVRLEEAMPPVVGTRDYGFPSDDLPDGLHDRAILTAEGTAPGSMGAGAGRPVSVRRLEMTVRRPSSGVEGRRLFRHQPRQQ